MEVTRTSRTDEQVAVIGQVAAPSLDCLHRQIEAAIDEVLGRPLRQQGVGEPTHDRDVIVHLLGGEIPVETKTQWIGRCHRSWHRQ